MAGAVPLVSVNVPTRNSASTLRHCLSSVCHQTLQSYEIIVADDTSTDKTREIASEMGAVVLTGELPLLQARFEAFSKSAGRFVLMLDSDQVLERDTLERAVESCEQYDALVLEEISIVQDSLTGRLLAADKRHLHRLTNLHLDPKKGTLLPRFFRHEALEAAFAAIPEIIRVIAVAQDHAIITSALGDQGASIGFLTRAVQHNEVESLVQLWSKNYRWGKGDAALFRRAPELRRNTIDRLSGRLRRGGAPLDDYARSMLLMALKSAPYALGYLSGRFGRSARRF